MARPTTGGFELPQVQIEEQAAFGNFEIGSLRSNELADARSRGIDLLDRYRRPKSLDERLGAALLLIAAEDAEYLRQAREDIEHLPWQEVQLWDLVARDQRGLPYFSQGDQGPETPAKLAAERLSADYLRQLEALLAMSNDPRALLYTADRLRQDGQETQAVELYGRMLDRPDRWGILAASSLAEMPGQRRRGIDRLYELLDAPDPYVRSGAAAHLAGLHGGREYEQLLDAWFDVYWSDGSPDMARAEPQLERLIERLRADREAILSSATASQAAPAIPER